jgi:hypothetical protein
MKRNNIQNPVTGKFIKKDIIWVGFSGLEYRPIDITDDFLKQIAIKITNGEGWPCIIKNKNKLDDIYQEVYNRNLFNAAVILNLYTWALYVNGFCSSFPSWYLTPDTKFPYFFDSVI